MPARTTVVLLLLALFSLTPIVCFAQIPASMTPKHNSIAQAHRNKGDKLLDAQKYSGALQEYQAAYALDQFNPTVRQDAGIDLRKIGNTEAALGQDAKAISCYKQSLQIAVQVGDTDEQANVFDSLGTLCDQLNQHAKAIDYYQQALLLFQDVKDIQGQIAALDHLGDAYYALGKFGNAADCYCQALILDREIKDKAGQASDLDIMGHCYLALNEYGKAMDCFQQTLLLCQQIKHRRGQALAFSDLGSASDHLNRYSQSIHFYQQALPLYRKIKDIHDQAQVLNNLGTDFRSLGDYAKAFRCYQQALTLDQRIKDKNGQAIAFSNLTITYEDIKQSLQTQHSSALGHSLQARADCKSARTLASKNDWNGAIKEYQSAYELDKVLHLNDAATDLEGMGLCRCGLNQSDKAMPYFQQALALYQKVENIKGQASDLMYMGSAYDDLSQFERAITCFQKALPLTQQTKNVDGQAEDLMNLGASYEHISHYQKAIKVFQQASNLYQKVKDWDGVANDLMKLGDAYEGLSQYDRAIIFFQKAYPIYQKVKDTEGQASYLINLGVVYNDLSQYEKATEYLKQALPLFLQTQDQEGEASDLINLGNACIGLSQYEKAIGYFQQALPVFQQVNNPDAQAKVLVDLGIAYNDLSQYEKASVYLQQALTLSQEVNDSNGLAKSLNNLGITYEDLSQYEKAIGYFQQALPIYQIVRDSNGQANDLNNLGTAYNALRQPDKSIPYFQQALSLYQKVKDSNGQANDLNNLGNAYADLGQFSKALTFFQKALALHQQIKDTNDQASDLINQGTVYDELMQYDKAMGCYQLALPIFQQIKDRVGEANTFNNLMGVCQDQDQTCLAIFYGKQSVNVYQSIRQNIALMDKAIQKDYLKNKEPTYRSLAQLLIDQNRLPEALQILNMLKQEEYLNFTQNTQEGTSILTEQAQMTALETQWNSQYQAEADTLAALGDKSETLRAQKKPTPEETVQIAALNTQITQATQKLQGTLTQIQIEALPVDEKTDRLDTQTDATKFQQTLAQLGHKSVAVYTLAGGGDLTVILITPTKITAYSTPIEAADLQKRIDDFRKALQYPDVDPRPYGKELYDLLIKPMEADLEADGAQTLMWSLDGSLRYIPIAALYDGKQYMVEKYTDTLFTPASDTQLTADPQAHWTGLGMGVSQPHPGFLALTNVPAELDGVIHDPSVADSKDGALPGTILLDEQFTQTALISDLAHHDPLVHIASHFDFQPGDAKDSFLLLGDGSHLSLADIQAMPDDLLAGVNLLTLSACETAADGEGANGKEVENLAVLAQRKGAQAVMATLWSVDDAATQQLMHEFYDDRQMGDGMSKGDALRQAQLSILGDASLAQATAARGARAHIVPDAKQTMGEVRPYHLDPAHPQVHPYYWAPFILIGNWK